MHYSYTEKEVYIRMKRSRRRRKKSFTLQERREGRRKKLIIKQGGEIMCVLYWYTSWRGNEIKRTMQMMQSLAVRGM